MALIESNGKQNPLIYVLDKDGKPLMPTRRCAKVRILRKQNLAKVVRREPFTIQLLYDTKGYTQPITLGEDLGYLNIGLSAVSEKEELFSAEVKMLEGQKDRLKDRRMYRRNRRQRLRYRAPRFNNRVSSKKEGWLAPSIKHKLDTQLKAIELVKSILPITKINIEVANFDTQKLENPDIQGVEYQNGPQKDFFNLREYILHRDDHKCTNPNCAYKDKPKGKILRIHHVIFKSCGGSDKPDNLTTVCAGCHTAKNHKEKNLLHDWMLMAIEAQKKGENHPVIKNLSMKSFKAPTFMSTIRKRVITILKSREENVTVCYGYNTKTKRIELGLEKTHYNDAFCIAGGETQKRCDKVYLIEQRRRNNRSLESFYDAKYIDIRDGKKVSGKDLSSGRNKRSTAIEYENLRKFRGEKVSKGRRSIRTCRYLNQPGDLVKFEDKIYTVIGTMNKGKSVKLDGIKKIPGASKLEPILRRSSFNFKVLK